jgi:hypothetical protein
MIMPFVNILIPLADGRALHYTTIRSIAAQTMQCNVIPLSRPEGYGPEGILLAQAANMNLLKPFASYPYTGYMDNDVYFTNSNQVEMALSFLSENPTIDAVALDTKGGNLKKRAEKKHVVIACFFIRTDKLDKYEFSAAFNLAHPRQLHCCPCIDFNDKLRVVYLDGVHIGEVK